MNYPRLFIYRISSRSLGKAGSGYHWEKEVVVVGGSEPVKWVTLESLLSLVALPPSPVFCLIKGRGGGGGDG